MVSVTQQFGLGRIPTRTTIRFQFLWFLRLSTDVDGMSIHCTQPFHPPRVFRSGVSASLPAHVHTAETPPSRCQLRNLLAYTASMSANLRKLLRLGFEIAALVAFHIPRWLVSGTRILLYEDRKGNWTLGRHLRVQMKQHMPGVWNK